MKRVLVSLIAICVVAWLVIGGVKASYVDTEQSTGNQFTAGTLDLKTNDADGVTQTLYLTNMKPGESIGPQTITLKNAGSIDGSSLDIDFSYVEEDGTNPPGNTTDKSADEFADELLVTTLTYDGNNLLTGITDADGDGVDMREVAAADLSGQSGIAPAATRGFTIAVQLKSGLSDDFCADGIAIPITFTLNQ